MELKIVNILRRNIESLIKLRNVPSLNSLSKSANIGERTLSTLMSGSFNSNPTMKIVERLAKELKVMPWMLLVEDFPFEQVKGVGIKSISGPTYAIANAMEQEPHHIKMLMMEAASHALMNVDQKQSYAIKEAQALYISDSTD